MAGNDVKARSGSHSVDMDSSPHAKPKANSSTKASKSEVLTVMDEGFYGQVALMIITAAYTNRPEDNTSETQSTCSRQLAEQLFGEWKPTEKNEYFIFDSSNMQCEFHKGALNLAKNDVTISTFEPITFNNNTFPFSHYLPKDDPYVSSNRHDHRWRYCMEGVSFPKWE